MELPTTRHELQAYLYRLEQEMDDLQQFATNPLHRALYASELSKAIDETQAAINATGPTTGTPEPQNPIIPK